MYVSVVFSQRTGTLTCFPVQWRDFMFETPIFWKRAGWGHLHDNVTLALGELHLLLEGAAEGVEVVAAGSDLLGREEAEPPKTSEDTSALLIVGELDLGVDGGDEVLLARRRGAEHLLEDLVPGQCLLAVGLLIVLEEAEVDEDLGELGVALVAEGATGCVSVVRACREVSGRGKGAYRTMVSASGML